MQTQVTKQNARPFFDVARELRRGNFLEECADELQTVIAAVEETGKAGKLVIEISVAPASKNQGAVKVSDRITAKLPALAAGETIMFVTPDNNLVANDPRQQSLNLKSVSAPTEEAPKQVSAA
jgi:uncharacterized protein with LGFP repeats